MDKLFFFDIDGTLLDFAHGIHSISKKTINSLNKLKENGHSVFLATGRCKCFILDEIMKYPFDGYVTCNGSYVEYRDKCIYKDVISKEALLETHKLCIENGWLYYFEGTDKIYTYDKEDKRHKDFSEKWGMKNETVYDVFSFDDIETYIGMLVLNDESQIPLVYERLSKYFDIQRHNHGYSFDLTLKNTSKGSSIKELCNRLEIDISNTVSFGDGRNDIEMLKTTGVGIAMGNAVDEAKDASDYVTDTVWDEGITSALKKYNFI